MSPPRLKVTSSFGNLFSRGKKDKRKDTKEIHKLDNQNDSLISNKVEMIVPDSQTGEETHVNTLNTDTFMKKKLNNRNTIHIPFQVPNDDGLEGTFEGGDEYFEAISQNHFENTPLHLIGESFQSNHSRLEWSESRSPSHSTLNVDEIISQQETNLSPKNGDLQRSSRRYVKSINLNESNSNTNLQSNSNNQTKMKGLWISEPKDNNKQVKDLIQSTNNKQNLAKGNSIEIAISNDNSTQNNRTNIQNNHQINNQNINSQYNYKENNLPITLTNLDSNVIENHFSEYILPNSPNSIPNYTINLTHVDNSNSFNGSPRNNFNNQQNFQSKDQYNLSIQPLEPLSGISKLDIVRMEVLEIILPEVGDSNRKNNIPSVPIKHTTFKKNLDSPKRMTLDSPKRFNLESPKRPNLLSNLSMFNSDSIYKQENLFQVNHESTEELDPIYKQKKILQKFLRFQNDFTDDDYKIIFMILNQPNLEASISISRFIVDELSEHLSNFQHFMNFFSQFQLFLQSTFKNGGEILPMLLFLYDFIYKSFASSEEESRSARLSHRSRQTENLNLENGMLPTPNSLLSIIFQTSFINFLLNIIEHNTYATGNSKGMIFHSKLIQKRNISKGRKNNLSFISQESSRSKRPRPLSIGPDVDKSQIQKLFQAPLSARNYGTDSNIQNNQNKCIVPNLQMKSSSTFKPNKSRPEQLNFDRLKLSINSLRSGQMNSDITSRVIRNISNEKETKNSLPLLASDLLKFIGSTLGETHISSDLTHLISIRRQIEFQKDISRDSFSSEELSKIPDTFRKTVSATKNNYMYTNDQIEMLQQIVNTKCNTLHFQFMQRIVNSNIPIYHISIFLIVKILLLCSRNTKIRRTSQQAINILSSHLLSISLPPQNIFHYEATKSIISLLALLSDDVESTYTNILKTSSAITTQIQKPRKLLASFHKLDHFLWRWKNSVDYILKNNDFKSLNHYLYFMLEYLELSTSRIQASQFCTVCLELLVYIQNIFQPQPITSEVALTIHYLFKIYRFLIMCPEKNRLILEFCFLNLVSNEDNWNWIKQYSIWLLFLKSEEHLKLEGPKSIVSLEDMQCSIIQYFQSLTELFKSYFEFENIQNYNHLCQSRLDFLIHPMNGLLLQHLLQLDRFQIRNSRQQKEILNLIAMIFKLGKPFIDLDSYASTYIQFHFMNFVELYSNDDYTQKTYDICTLHIDVLIALSRNKSSYISDQFHSLQVVNFLSKEIDFEVQLNDKSNNQVFTNLNESNEQFQFSQKSNQMSDSYSHDDEDGSMTEASIDTDLTSVSDTSDHEFEVPGLSLAKYNISNSKPTLTEIESESIKSKKKETNLNTSIEKINVPQLFSIEKKQNNFKSIKSPTIHNSDESATNSSSEEEDFNFSIPNRKPTTIENSSFRSSVASTSAISISLTNSNVNDTHSPLKSPDSEFNISKFNNNNDSFKSNKTKNGSPQYSEDESMTETSISQNEEDDLSSDDSFFSIDDQQEDEFEIPKIGLKISRLNDEQVDDKIIAKNIKKNKSQKNDSHNIKVQDLEKNEDKFTIEYFYSKKNDNLNSKQLRIIEKRKFKRKIYYDQKLHSSFICLLLNLLLTEYDTLDSRYTEQHPHLSGMPNILFMLFYHINDDSNLMTIERLRKKVTDLKSVGSEVLFKMLCIKSFDPTIYSNVTKRIGYGGFANVWEVQLDSRLKTAYNSEYVAVKIIKLPQTSQDRCVWHDSFNEIFIMEKHSNSPFICKMYDFGVDKDNLYIVLEKYDMSLRNWRSLQTYSMSENLPIYMEIFRKVLQCVEHLSYYKINHFDIKCDNIFLKKLPGVSDDDFLNQKKNLINFSIIIGDFGESFIYGNDENSYTLKHRGTSCIKSPEMLKIEMMSSSSKFYDRRRKVGAGKSSDIWSIGCLLFELLSGDYLFDATDFGHFFEILTNPQMTLIPQSSFQKIEYHPLMFDILSYILIRDPNRRPTIENILERFPSWIKPIPSLQKLRSHSNINLNNIVKTKNSPVLQMKEDEVSEGFKLISSRKSQFTHNLGKIVGLLSARDFSLSLHFETALFNRIRLCTDDEVNDKKMLYKFGITHIISCVQTEEEASHLSHFDDNYFFHVLQQISLYDDTMDIAYTSAIQFIMHALKTNGNVLIFGSSKNISRCIILLLIIFIEVYGLSSLEAYVSIRRMLPISLPSNIISNYIGMLNENSTARKRMLQSESVHNSFNYDTYKSLTEIHSKKLYRCFCGKCIYGFESSHLIEGRTIKIKESSLSDETSPLKSYPHFIYDMQSLYSRNDFAIDSQLEFGYLAQEQQVIRAGAYRFRYKQFEDTSLSDLWIVYVCETCGFVTHCLKRSSIRKTGIVSSTLSEFNRVTNQYKRNIQEHGNAAVHCGYPFDINTWMNDYRKETILKEKNF